MFRKLMLSLMSLLLTVSMVATQGFVTVRAEEARHISPIVPEANYQSSSPDAENAHAYINLDMDKSGLLHKNQTGTQNLTALPSSYSLVSEGYVTSVKNQNPYGTCWTFSTMASAESGVLMRTGQTKDFAELQMAYFFYKSYKQPDQLGLITNDGTAIQYNNQILDMGGNAYFSTFALANGIGFSNETDYPYTKASTYIYSGTTAPCYNSTYMLRSARWLLMSESDVVKQALMENGALAVAYHHADNESLYYNPSTGAYYQNRYGANYANHAVTLVGWDDNYSRNNFVTKPSKNGAWLIKNSWGTSWGNSGYFWISYEDKSLTGNEAVFYEVELDDTYSSDTVHLYQYDGSGMAGYEDAYGSSFYQANTYETLGDQELLTDVGFFIDQTDIDYTIYIYKNVTNTSNPTSGTLALTQNGHLDDAGYYLIPLNSEISLSQGELYSVVIKLASSGETVFMFLDWTDTWDYSDGDVYFYNDVSHDYSFVSTNGTSWDSLTAEGYTARIKAVTRDDDNVTRYTVNFVNYDGTVLQSTKVAEGAMPVYRGETPTRPSDEQFNYTFAGWDPELTAVTGDATYTANYTEQLRKYQIRFVNYNGSLLRSTTVAYGDTPVYNGSTPKRPSDAQYSYEFIGWDPEIAPVTGPATYKAVFRAVELGDLEITSLTNEGTSGGILVSYSEAAGAEAYEVQVSEDGGQNWLTLTDSVENNSYSDASAIWMGTTYSYRVRASVDGQWGGWTEVKSLVRNPFIDVPEGTDDFTHVAWAYNHGIVGGAHTDEGDVFKLDGLCTRAQFCIMLYKMNGLPDVDISNLPFRDIDDQTSNTKKAIVWCYDQSIVAGARSDNTIFSPKGNIKRSQLAIMLYKMAGEPSVSLSDLHFTDIADLTATTKKAIVWCYQNEIIPSISGEEFQPNLQGSRALLTEMLYGYEQLFHIVEPED